MRIFTAGLVTETSDLTPLATTKSEWRVESPDDSQESSSIFRSMLTLFKSMCHEENWQVEESICATALPPGGRSVKSVYEDLRDKILSDLKNALPVDAVLLQLHGASMAHGYDDCEGDLLEKVRLMIGKEVPIGVELDPHCHLSQKMMENATIMILYKTWFHTDIEDRAIELFHLMARTLKKEIKPVMALFDCKSIDMYDEAYEPMKSFYQRGIETEKLPGILSISPVHGFPLADVPDMGSKMLVITDNNLELAVATAKELGEAFHQVKGQQFKRVAGRDSAYVDVAEALSIAKKQASQGKKGIKLVEWGDLAGCGFPTDGTELLESMLNEGMTNLAVGLMWDPLAVSICMDVGQGQIINMRIGGKASQLSGKPLDLRVSIDRVIKDLTIQTWVGDVDLGDTAVVSIGDAQMILVSQRALGYGVEVFSDLGVDLDKKQYLILKYMRGSEDAINVLGKNFDPLNWPFTRISRPKWPWDDNTLGIDGDSNA